jgi:hypothetical protein
VSVIVDNTLASSLTAKLHQFQQDLLGDGWTVSLHLDAPRMDDELYIWANQDGEGRSFANENLTPGVVAQYAAEIQIVKDMINADNFDGQLKQVILIGHVTVPYSGVLLQSKLENGPSELLTCGADGAISHVQLPTPF